VWNVGVRFLVMLECTVLLILSGALQASAFRANHRLDLQAYRFDDEYHSHAKVSRRRHLSARWPRQSFG